MTAIDPAPSLGLLTDLYQLTMAAGYWKTGLAERESVFHLFFRKPPFQGGYAVACGLEQVLEYLERFRFGGADLAYLAELEGNDGKPLFDAAFLETLAGLELACDIDAIPEGTVVFPHEPLLRVRGPLAQCQILETPLLTLVNFQTLIATKAARVSRAARGDAVIEFGLRRAQGLDGGLSASRAAYVGGCVGTSNVMAGRRFGIPVMGTHAHSWVTSFPTEAEAFDAYARSLPNNCTFLVDTYDTLTGVRNAIEAGKRLRRQGYEMAGIRLDSGDLLGLSVESRRLLDEAGFPDASIVASNDLDEHAITELKAGGAEINVWGVGTRLATAYDQPALGGVYKLTAYREGDEWRGVIKLSEEKIKIFNPGVQQVRRYSGPDGFLADVIFDETGGLSDAGTWFDQDGVEWDLPSDAETEDLLVPIVRGGRSVYEPPAIVDVRQRTLAQLQRLPGRFSRLKGPDTYPVGLYRDLHRLKERLIAGARNRLKHIPVHKALAPDWEDDDIEDIEDSTAYEALEVDFSVRETGGLGVPDQRGSSRGFPDDEQEEDRDPFELPREFEVWFGTNRKRQEGGTTAFTSERGDRIHYGTCVVDIPKTHELGSIGSPFWKRWPKLEFKSDQLRILRYRHLEKNDFWSSVQSALGHFSTDEQTALVFIHGYNTSFEEAALRAAQLGFDLKITGVTAFFSWPSKGRIRGYFADRSTAEASEPYITEFLVEFAERSGCPRVHVLAHSMGNYGFLRSVDRIVSDAARRSAVRFEQIFLAAPDVDIDLFHQLAPRCLDLSARTTLYVSTQDLAVKGSSIIQDYPRAGFAPPMTVVSGIDTIEASGVDVTRLGHGYYAEARPLLADVHSLLLHDSSPARRLGLSRRQTPEGRDYWKLSS